LVKQAEEKNKRPGEGNGTSSKALEHTRRRRSFVQVFPEVTGGRRNGAYGNGYISLRGEGEEVGPPGPGYGETAAERLQGCLMNLLRGAGQGGGKETLFQEGRALVPRAG